jgi:hypothetical protein
MGHKETETAAVLAAIHGSFDQLQTSTSGLRLERCNAVYPPRFDMDPNTDGRARLDALANERLGTNDRENP